MGFLAPIAAIAAAAAPAASTLATVGAVVGAAGTLFSGFQANAAAKAEAAQIEEQRRTELALSAVEDGRIREEFAREIAAQRLSLAGRGVTLDSPSSLLLGRAAAREMSFASQSRRSQAQAGDRELSFAARNARARGAGALLSGVSTAGSRLLSAAPDLFPAGDPPFSP